jgi:hypothetical protein
MVRRILKTVGVVDVPKVMNGCTGVYRTHFNIVLQQFGVGRLTFYARRFVLSLFIVVSRVPRNDLYTASLIPEYLLKLT